jgi:tRNA A-37 threonylcarbamoyl transferase component Bud32
MGVLYSARDPQLNRRVALKMLREDRLAGIGIAESQRRLLREAQALAQLSHPNVVAVFDAGTFAGQVFIALELVSGRTLRAWLREAPRAWQDMVERFIAAGRGLAAAHDAGFVHRDFKPENVLVGDDGRVRVTDFGLARPSAEPPANPSGDEERLPGLDLHGSLATLTETGHFAGTPRYMAPEQMAAGAIDGRTDQFSFCVALHEAVYGRPPFEAETVEQLLIQIQRGPAAPAGSNVPEWLHAVLARGLRAAPGERYPTMEDLLTALGSGLGGRRAAATRPAGERARSRGVRPAIAVAGVAAALLAGVAAVHPSGSGSPARPRSAAQPARAAAVALSPARVLDPPAPVPVRPGILLVRANVPSRIVIDGRTVVTAGSQARVEVEPDRNHRVEVSAAHRIGFQTDVRVTAGALVELPAELARSAVARPSRRANPARSPAPRDDDSVKDPWAEPRK